MAQQKKGLIARMLEGKERSEEYARSTLPTNRWSLFWDIFKGNFGKIFKVNLLTILFFIPLFAVIIIGNMMSQTNSVTYPFGANVGLGYPAQPNLQGVSQWLTLQGDFYTQIGIFVACFIASVGLAGGMYTRASSSSSLAYLTAARRVTLPVSRPTFASASERAPLTSARFFSK